MRTVCSQCRRVVRDDGDGEAGGAAPSFALCAECEAYATLLRTRLPGPKQLDSFPRPVLVTTAAGRVVAANRAFAALSGHVPADLEGWRTGDAMACERTRLPGGCGGTMHCRDCTIRRMVAEVGRTRLARWRVPAYVATTRGRREVCVTIRPEGEDLVVVVLDELPAHAETV
jgi:PAS domain-containing protein